MSSAIFLPQGTIRSESAPAPPTEREGIEVGEEEGLQQQQQPQQQQQEEEEEADEEGEEDALLKVICGVVREILEAAYKIAPKRPLARAIRQNSEDMEAAEMPPDAHVYVLEQCEPGKKPEVIPPVVAECYPRTGLCGISVWLVKTLLSNFLKGITLFSKQRAISRHCVNPALEVALLWIPTLKNPQHVVFDVVLRSGKRQIIDFTIKQFEPEIEDVVFDFKDYIHYYTAREKPVDVNKEEWDTIEEQAYCRYGTFWWEAKGCIENAFKGYDWNECLGLEEGERELKVSLATQRALIRIDV
ncbi:hypothetical protein BDV95DRAFT_614520 [Massariosphaeria phaeospora]|uniref:Uncharacterized protein n=1 Tax=Massariosphaeria phaeospora TaxID=100035 RepID=A0A7C8MFP6_9PLEO|nr:hypothetical protein BDV95DRAFT_614520 [Massariosphaeria phaeospora]